MSSKHGLVLAVKPLEVEIEDDEGKVEEEAGVSYSLAFLEW